MTCFCPLSALRATSPEGGSETTRHSERSEESHRVSAEYIICGNSPSREFASRCSQRQFIKQVDGSVGYFADAQYDVLCSGGLPRLWLAMTAKTRFAAARSLRRYNEYYESSVGYFACAQYDVFFCPLSALRATSPEGGSKVDSWKSLPRRRKWRRSRR